MMTSLLVCLLGLFGCWPVGREAPNVESEEEPPSAAWIFQSKQLGSADVNGVPQNGRCSSVLLLLSFSDLIVCTSSCVCVCVCVCVSLRPPANQTDIGY